MRLFRALRALPAAVKFLVPVLFVAVAGVLGVVAVASGDAAPGSSDLRGPGLRASVAGDEVVGLRTEYSRSYRKADGGLQTRVGLSPVNYRDSEGKWRVIDPTLRRTASGLQTTAGLFDVKLPERANAGRVRLSRGPEWLSFGLRGASSSAAALSGAKARFENALPATRVEYEAGSESVKESLVLASSSAPSSFTFDVSASAGLTPQINENGEVVFRDSAGTRKFTMATPWMRDAAGELSYDVHYEVDPAADGWVVRLVADDAWLDAPGRQYPVVVDPTTYYGISKLCEIASGSLANSNDCTTADMPVDVGRENGRVHRALVQFDTAELRDVLGDSLVTNADLYFWWTSSTNPVTDVALDVHALSRSWSAVATWNKYTSVSYWTRPGGDYSTTVETRRTLQAGWAGGWTGLGVGGLVQGWLDGSITNNGVVVKPQNEGLVRLDTLSSVGLVVDSRPRRGAEPQATFETVRPTSTSKVQVNVGNGNLLFSDEDARLPAGSNALTAERTFNGLGDLATGTFGTGWSTNHGVETTLWQHWVDGSYILEGSGGLAGRFHRTNDGPYTAPPGWNASLTQNTDGTVSITFNATGERWDFDTTSPARRLTKITKGTYEQTFTYGTAGITQATDNQGNQLTYTYDPQTGRLTALSNGSAQRTYNLDTNNRLLQTTPATGTGTAYAYDGNGRLQEITYPGASKIALAYDSTGRVTSLVEKPDSNSANDRTTTFAYSGPTSPCVGTDYGKTVVTYPNAQTRTYCYSRTDAVRTASPATTSDVTDPVLTLSGKAWENRADWHSTGTLALNVFASDAHSGIKSLQTKLDGTTIDTNTQTCAAGGCTMERAPSIDTSSLSTGTHTVQVIATDQANRTTTRSWDLKVDKGNPTATLGGTLYTQRADWFSSGTRSVTVDATDTVSGVKSIEVLSDGARVDYATQPCSGGACAMQRTTDLTAAGLGTGSHTITVLVTDHAGGTNQQQFTVKVDAGDPAITLTGEVYDSRASWFGTSTRGLTVNATDGGSGVKSVETLIDGTRVDFDTQACPAGGCSMQRQITVDAQDVGSGTHTVRVVATDQAERTSEQQFTIKVDNAKPDLTVTGSLWDRRDDWVGASTLSVQAAGTDALSGVASVEILLDGQRQSIETAACGQPPCDVTASASIDTAALDDGLHVVQILALDNAGQLEQRSWTLKVDTADPTIALSGTVAAAAGGTLSGASNDLTVTASDGVAPDAGSGIRSVEVLIDGNRDDLIEQPCPDGGCDLTNTWTYTREQLPAGQHTIKVIAIDGAGRDAETEITFTVDADAPVRPPIQAPALDDTVPTEVKSATEFLYTGANPAQTGVDPDTIETKSAAVIRGKVTNRQGDALGGVVVSVLDHPEFGEMTTRDDGQVYLAVNGGGELTVNYQLDGYLPVQRTLDVDWQQWEHSDPVVMIQADEQATAVDFTGGLDDAVVHQSEVTDDDAGERRTTLVLPEGEQATMKMPDGSTQPVDEAHIRATEYTVGDSGAEAMPAELPATTGYTYAVNYSIDEAQEAGATSVKFTKPVVAYQENFLDFPVGVAVPVGYLNRDTGKWEPQPDGRVIKILSENNGKAVLDVTGFGNPATTEELDWLHIDDDELIRLADLYQPGDELWRTRVTHFSAFDLNWAIRLLDGAVGWLGRVNPTNPNNPCEASGSVIGCEDQTLGESIDVPGTGLQLHYRSNRLPGYKAGREIRLRLTGDTRPPNLVGIHVQVEIAGRQLGDPLVRDPRAEEPPNHPFAPNEEYRVVWDGKDAFGRTVTGSQVALIRVGYEYETDYATGTPYVWRDGEFPGEFWSWASPPEPAVVLAPPPQYVGSGNPSSNYGPPDPGSLSPRPMPRAPRQTIWKQYKQQVGGIDLRASGVAGWTLSNHHSYDAGAHRLIRGDGRTSTAEQSSRVVRHLADIKKQPVPVQWATPSGVAVAPDGTVYLGDEFGRRILKRSPSGAVSVFAGGGDSHTNGALATDAWLGGVLGIAIGPDGSVYFAEGAESRVRRVGPDGRVWNVAGTSTYDSYGDGFRANQAALNRPNDVAVAPDGTVYIADTFNNRVRRVEPSGSISTFMTTGSGHPVGVAVGPDGAVYAVADFNAASSIVYRRYPSSTDKQRIAGGGSTDVSPDPDGVPLADASVMAGGIDVAPNGDLYILEAIRKNGGTDYGVRIRRVGNDGRIYAFAGGKASGCTADEEKDGVTATRACLGQARGIAFGPDGNLYFTSLFGESLQRIEPSMPGITGGNALVASEDGSELYEFDATGRHQRTLDADTHGVLATFSYDSEGRLISEQDTDGNTVTVQRDGSGKATGILGPFGAHTTLTENADGLLTGATDPEGATTSLTYGTDGLLTSLTEPGNKTHTYAYDSDGRLTSDQSPDGEATTLSRTELTTAGHEVTLTSNLGRTRKVLIEPDGDTSMHRKGTDAAGNVTDRHEGTDGNVETTAPDGTTTKAKQIGDPRFGPSTPFVSNSLVTLPSGRSLAQTSARTAELATPGNLETETSHTSSTTVNGKTATGTFVKANRRYTSTTPGGRQWKIDVDTKGRITRSEVAGEDPVQFAYDTRGRIDTVTSGTRTWTYGYASTGYLQTIQGPENTSASYSTDNNGRVTTATLPGSRQIGFTHDQRGQLTSLTPPGKTAHSFEYTDGGKISRIVPPAIAGVDGDTEFSYDTDGALASMTRPGGEIIDVDYDTAGRPSSISSADGDIAVTYHAGGAGKGKLATITAPGSQSLAFSYDGPLVTSLTASGGTDATLTYDYDSDLRPASVALNGGGAVGYGYDSDGLLTTVGPLSISRDAPTGRATGTQLGDVSTSQTYDGQGRLQTLTATVSGSGLRGSSYTYDGLDRITAKTETSSSGSTSYGYEYDSAGRLQRVTKDGQTWRQYTYDQNGNRTADQTAGQLAVTSTFDAQDRLTARGSEQFTYTDAGELATRTDTSANETTTYHHSARGLTGVDLPDGTHVTYKLDGFGRRVAVSHDGQVIRRYLYGLEAIGPVAELNADNTVRTRFIYGTRSNVPEYMIRAGVTYRIVTDELGSVRRVVNTSTGAVAQAIEYDPYGAPIADSDPGFQPFGYAGGLQDRDTGLTRFGYRDYDPALGRWISKDPIGFDGGTANLYAYVSGDPVNGIDPSGLFLDTLVDIGFVTYDLATIAGKWAGGCGTSATDLAALGADIGAAFVPFATGAGAAARGAEHAGSAAKAGEGAGGKAIVLGEDMEGRVIPTAKRLGADYYKPPKAPPEQWMDNNRRWINERMDEGCTIFDCGAAPGRANYPEPTSPYYKMEQEEIAKRGYPTHRVEP